MMQRFLRDMVIVQPAVSLERLLEVFACSIAPGRQHVADTAVEALHHSIRLRPSRLDQAVLNPVGQALLIEGMAPAGLALTCPREAIRERLAVVGQHRLNLEGRLLLHLLHKRPSILRGLAASDLQVDPACRTVDGPMCQRSCRLIISVDNHALLFTGT